MTDSPDLADFVRAERARPSDASETIRRALKAVRCHLGMQVAYVSRFDDDRSIFCEVDAPGLEHLVKPGDSRSLNDVYCRHILQGRLPQLMPDTAAEPLAMAMPITKAASIGAHVSVPILLPNGEPYGMFCCLGFAADHSLNERDLQTMKAFAEIASFEINRELEAEARIRDKRTKIERVIAENQLSMAFQPIWDVEAGRIVGFEGLARFSATPYRSPDQWFAEAAEVGMGAALEVEAIRRALRSLSVLPPPIYLGVNASPATILRAEFAEVLRDAPLERVVIEVTEHSSVENYEAILDALLPLRANGLRLAIDDAGAGYASLRHILRMKPDFIKLDIELTWNIDLDPARKALTSALIAFARDTGSRIIAEGVERQGELETLRSIGVKKVQGYLLGRPTDLDSALKILADLQKKRDAAA
jgi:EAL domain-containing protein (putative c-di-GMP-specific phosphodiesterase class I)